MTSAVRIIRPMKSSMFYHHFPSKCLCAGSRLFCERSYGNRGQPSPYEILEIKPTATPKEIRVAFIQMSKKYHPDTNPEDITLNQKFSQIVNAYTTLTNKKAKKTVGNKTTGEGFTYSDETSFDDDPLIREHHAFMSSREYFHFDKSEKEKEAEEKVWKAQIEKNSMSMSRGSAFVNVSAFALVIYIAFHLLRFLKIENTQTEKTQTDPVSDKSKDKDSYFNNLENKLKQKYSMREEQMNFRKKRLYLQEQLHEQSPSISQPKTVSTNDT